VVTITKNHFLSAAANERKLFVIGDEREFADWVKNGWLVAHKSSKQEVGNLLGTVARDLKTARQRMCRVVTIY